MRQKCYFWFIIALSFLSFKNVYTWDVLWSMMIHLKSFICLMFPLPFWNCILFEFQVFIIREVKHNLEKICSVVSYFCTSSEYKVSATQKGLYFRVSLSSPKANTSKEACVVFLNGKNINGLSLSQWSCIQVKPIYSNIETLRSNDWMKYSIEQ